jgi:serine/threonine protein kinase
MSNKEPPAEAVYVIEAIPTGGGNEIDRATIDREGIPTPAHLRLYPELGRGGMGRIHPATDRNLLRHVALKRLDKELSQEPMYREGFIAEAQITGQLEHPNIVPVHELAVSELGVPYFTMKLVQGYSFDKWLSHPLRRVGSRERLEEGLETFLKVCDAVAYAHHRGVIHRDLKPENIMVGDFGQAYLMDWGLAKLTRRRPASGQYSQMEAPGAVGTVTHMAPEQARGNPKDMDERSDVFGLGAILYEIATGRTPYGRYTDYEAHLALAQAGKVIRIADIAQHVPIPPRLAVIVDRAVAPSAADRYQTVSELRRDVHEFMRGGLHLPQELHEPGSVILREGELGDKAYMIVSGQCRAFRAIGSQREVLGTMGPGEVFGEMALLLAEPRAASVEAVDQVTLLVLDKHTMTEGLGIDGWTGALVRALAQRFRRLEQQFRDSGLRRG